jgi:hypothetical protein
MPLGGRATKRHRDDRATHHIEQDANASGLVKSLEPAHEIDERPCQDSD